MIKPSRGVASAAGLSDDLDGLAVRAVASIRVARVRRVIPRAWELASASLWVVPAVIVLLELLRLVTGGAAKPWSWPALLGLALLPALLVFALVLLAAWRRAVGKRRSLAALDRAAGLRDRLVTADEFLTVEPRTDFMAAALEDAASHIEQARRARLTPTAVVPRRARVRVDAVVTAVLLLSCAGLLSRLQPGVAEPAAESLVERATIVGREPDALDRPRDPTDGQEPPTPTARATGASIDSEPADDQGRIGEDIKQTRGQLGSGRPAQASASQGSSRSKAAPTNQNPSTKVDQPPKPTTRSDEEPERIANDTPPPEQRPSEESGTTAGRGSSRGSNKNPASTDWSSKDQVTNPEDEGVDDDQEIEDEEEEQESRGGIQPNLRDRKPPVNRDLRIGFGNRKNPDANGRGGPSEQKKSRGVASLVLGVPVPDRIKGQPNRGRTKITQERIEPKAEDARPIAAQARAARDQPIGLVTRYDLEAWMQRLVRQYFLFPPDTQH